MQKILIVFILLCTSFLLKAQDATFLVKGNQQKGVIIDGDTLLLPFAISTEKKLSNEDIINKKEGWYVTGLPEISVDPIRGVSAGANAFLFSNRDKNDPFFYYTPYRIRYGVGLRVAQNGRVAGELNVDIPFAFNSKWRLRGDIIYANDPNFQYFGIGSETLERLNYEDKQTGDFVENTKFRDYNENLAFTRPGRGAMFGEDPNTIYTDAYFNELSYSQFLFGLAAERTFFEGRMRLMFGLEYLQIGIGKYDFQTVPDAIDRQTGEDVGATQARTRLTNDFLDAQNNPENSSWGQNNIGGYEGGRINLIQAGLMWDTRDLEPDPSNGIFAEYAQEISGPYIASEFNFTKHLLQGIFYKKLFPSYLGKTVFTGRVALGYIRGSNIPFTEVVDLWGSSEGGGIPVLGGARALRGYRESRFAGLVTGLANFEVRSRFYQTRLLNQHFALYAVPFFDVGSVWDSFGEMNLNNIKHNPGLGMRIAWNQATILRLDYAISQEDSQFFFVFGHTF